MPKYRQRLSGIATVCGVLAAATGVAHALGPEQPWMDVFVERLVTSIQPDGRFDVAATFDCHPPDREQIVSCLDLASGVGFRFRREDDADVVDIAIVLQEDGSEMAGPLRGQIAVRNVADYKWLETRIARLPESTALKALEDCSLGPAKGSNEPVVWIAERNPVSGNVIGFLLADSLYPTLGLKGDFNAGMQGHQVSDFVVVNALRTRCHAVG